MTLLLPLLSSGDLWLGFLTLFAPCLERKDWASLVLFPQLSQKLDAGNQLALIEELHKEIRFIGNECKGEHVPGFCLPKKVSQGLLPVLDPVHHALDLSSEAVSAGASEWARGGSCASPLSPACWVPCPPVRSHCLGSGSGPATV